MNEPAGNHKFDTQWVWFPEGNPSTSAPLGTRYFRRLITIPADRQLQSATLRFTSDNDSIVSLNARPIGSAGDSHELNKVDLSAALHPGENLITALGKNTGDKLNPAGFIARLDATFTRGDPMALTTDASWKSSNVLNRGWDAEHFDDHAWANAEELGPAGTAPWGYAASTDRTL